MDTSHRGQGGDTLSRQRSGRLRSELHGTGTYPGGVNSRLGRDLPAVLATVTNEITQLRQIAAATRTATTAMPEQALRSLEQKRIRSPGPA